MRVRLVLGVVAVVLASGGCGGKSSPTPTTASGSGTPTTVAATTTTMFPPDPPVKGSDDTSVEKRLTNAITVEFTLFTSDTRFSADPTTLTSVDPAATFGTGLVPPLRPDTINVAVSADAQYVCLTGKSSAGHVLVAVLGPSIDAYAGRGPLRVCNASSVSGLVRVNR